MDFSVAMLCHALVSTSASGVTQPIEKPITPVFLILPIYLETSDELGLQLTWLEQL